MNCKDWEEKIALAAGGDLEPHDAAAVEAHLEQCAGCRRFSEAVRWSLATLREAHQEPVAAAHFAAVRSQVLERLERRPRRVTWPVWAAGLAAAVALLLMLFPGRRAPVRSSPAPPPPPLQVAETDPNPAPVPVPPPVGRKVRTRRVRKTQPPAAGPLMVQLVTDDPDVVIYWIVDPKGD